MLSALRSRLPLCSAWARALSSSLLPDDLIAAAGSHAARTGRTAGCEEESDSLGRRLLSLVFRKRSAVVVLRKWVEEGKTVRKYQLNRVVRELRKYKRYKHALEVCEWMTTEPHIKLLPGDYAVHLDLVGKVRGLASAEKFFEDLPVGMKAQSTCTALLHTFAQNGLLDKAESLMEEMSALDFLNCALPYNHMLELYISKGQLNKIPDLLKNLKNNTSPDGITFNLWLTVFAKRNDVVGAEKVLHQMAKDKITPDWVTYSTLTSIYIKAASPSKAKETLAKMEEVISKKERVAYCSLISLHTSLLDKGNVYRIWNKMKGTFRKMSDTEYRCMLSSLTKLGSIEEAESIYSEWETASTTGDSRLPNILLAFYIKNNMFEKAEKFLAHIMGKGVKPSYTTWELFAWGNLEKNRIDQVMDCLKKAVSSVEKWDPNVGLVEAVLSKVEKMGSTEDAENSLVILRNAGYVTTEIYNSLLRTYARAGRMPLIVAERMEKDQVEMDEETKRLLRLTSQFCIGEVSTLIS